MKLSSFTSPSPETGIKIANEIEKLKVTSVQIIKTNLFLHTLHREKSNFACLDVSN